MRSTKFLEFVVVRIFKLRLTIPRPLRKYVYKHCQVTSPLAFSLCRTLERSRKKLAKIVGDCGDHCGQLVISQISCLNKFSFITIGLCLSFAMNCFASVGFFEIWRPCVLALQKILYKLICLSFRSRWTVQMRRFPRK
jgi:hypothetical protein